MSKYSQFSPQQQYQDYDEGYSEDDYERMQDQTDQQQYNQIAEQPQNERQYQPQGQEQAPPANPYYKGIDTAIAEARSRFAQTRDQRDRALRSSVLAFGKDLGSKERERGFGNNMLSALESFGPAVTNYDANTVANEGSNEKLSNNILQIQAAQQAKQQQQDQFYANLAAKQQAQEAQDRIRREQMNEMRRHHTATEDAQRGLLDFKTNKYTQNAELDSIAPLIRTPSIFDKIGLQTDTAANFYEEVKDVKERYEDLKATMAQAGIDVTNPLVFKASVRNARNVISSLSKDPVQRAIAQKYADVQASNKRLMQTAEKALKAGALTNFTVKYGDQNNLFPNFDENFDIYETKLDHMLSDATKSVEASELSLQLGRHVNKRNFDKIKQVLQAQQQQRSQEDMPPQDMTEMGSATMMDANGVKYVVPVNEVPAAIQDGLQLVD